MSRLVALLFLATQGILMGQEVAPVLDISDGWKFRTGDGADHSRIELDESAWRPIETGRGWEDQGYPDYDGYAWYRLRFTVPEEWKEHDSFIERGALAVDLGRIDDVDETWFNGVKIGSTGSFPGKYEPAWQIPRRYVVPSELIRWGAENVLAVRVYDGAQSGGMCSGACSLSIAAWADLLKLEFDLQGTDGTFEHEGAAEVGVRIRNVSSKAVEGHLRWTVHSDEGDLIGAVPETPRFELSPGGGRRLTQPFDLSQPGFYRVDCEWILAGGIEGSAKSMIIGYRPLDVASPLTKEKDFEAFWMETRAQLSGVDPQFEVVRVPNRDSETHQVFEVRMRSLGGVRVGGWYEQPKGIDSKKVPAVLRVPGYGSNMAPTGRAERFAFFSFNVRGHGNSQDDVKGTPQNFWIRGLDDKDGYYYRGAYADCMRALDFLVTRPEVDIARIAITGGSQGGGLSLATAALDDRIALCAPDIPFLCDWRKYFKASKWPEIDQWIAAKEERSWESTLRTMSYFDALNLADRIKCPVFLGIGLQDAVCPAHTIFAVYNRLVGERSYRIYPRAEHRVGSGHEDLRYRWLNEQFQKGR
ncbi:MAG: acetylxylan esterase [Verrucomicrobiales bacterium]